MSDREDRVPVSVVIAARNEAHDIAACVASVAWAAEVLVVENDSTDDTVTVARAAGATVFSHPFVTIGGQRNAAIARAAHPWILVVDADERATPALGREVARCVAEPAAYGAWRIARRNVFLGGEVRHGGWGDHDAPIRLFRAHYRYDSRAVHERVVTEGPLGRLTERLWHEPYASLDEYLEKVTRYARDWATQHHARGRRAGVGTLLARPMARFVTMLLVRGGWRDGARGVALAMLAAVSVAAKYALLWEKGLGRETRR